MKLDEFVGKTVLSITLLGTYRLKIKFDDGSILETPIPSPPNVMGYLSRPVVQTRMQWENLDAD